MSALEIPWRELSADALQGVIEEFVTREGTEYGLCDVDLPTKVAQVHRQLERGEIRLFFDAASGSCHLLTREEARRRECVARAGSQADLDADPAGNDRAQGALPR